MGHDQVYENKNEMEQTTTNTPTQSSPAPATYTPGPWYWDANPKSKTIYLASAARGRMNETVLTCERWGMQSAIFVFHCREGILAKASDYFRNWKGRDHHADWAQTIDHPDAHLIAAAPELFSPLAEIWPMFESCIGQGNGELEGDREAIARAKAAIARATGAAQ
jgi:hypothetical protein